MRVGIDRWKRAQEAGLNLLFPPLCMICREQIAQTNSLCAACWQKIGFLDGPACACCGLPFEIDPGPGTRCGACHARQPAFDKARAIMRYDEASKGPILALKHADRLDHVPGFARWLARSGHELIAECDVIVPVPLHAKRLWARRYNQAAELARALSRLSGKAAELQVLLRAKPTPSQGEMPSAQARRRNVQGAFAVPAARRPIVAGKVTLLVDDVLTTGATVEACATVLKRAGAQKVHVLALARVVRPLSVAI